MGKIVFGTIGILLYKYLPRLITFVPLGVSKAFVCAAMIMGYILYDKDLQKKIKEKFPYIRFFFFGILLWLSQSIGVGILLMLIKQVSGYEISAVSNEHIVIAPWLYVFISVILGPIVEEFLFRGLLQEGLSKISEKKSWQILAIVITSAFFGILHQIPAQRLSAFITGCVFGWIYYKKKDVRYGCMLHIGNNFMATLLSYVLAATII